MPLPAQAGFGYPVRVAKGNRKERRAAEAARALAAGHVGALSRRAQQGAEHAARPIVEALRAAPAAAADSGELLALAADVAGRLRREQKLALALEVAAAGEARSPRLRLEHALSAFALGRDDEAAAIAAPDAGVARAMEPLLSATRLGSERKASRAVASGDEAAANAVYFAARGKHALARRALACIPEPERDGLFARPLAAAVALAGQGAAFDELELSILAGLPRTETFAAVRCAAAEEAAAISPELGAKACRVLGLGPEVARRIEGLAAWSRPRAGDPFEAAMALARDVGADAFAPEERARASLYEGFAHLDQDRERAGRAFERAVKLGGDIVEALRGRLLLTLRAGAGAVCPDCGARHGAATPTTGAPADRLARALDRVPDGGHFAVAARLLAAEAWGAAGDERAGLAALAAARLHATGKAADLVDLEESRLVALTRPDRARGLLEAVTERSPGNVDAWTGRIAFASASGDLALAERLETEAARATSDPLFVARARAFRARAGKLAPFEGLVAGVATAGILALEIERLQLSSSDGGGPDAKLRAILDAEVARHRAALGPNARFALDAARMALAAPKAGPDGGPLPSAELRELVLSLLRDGSADATATGKLVAVVVRIGGQDDLVAAARALVREDAFPGAAPPATLVEAAAAVGDADLARRLLGILSPGLTRSEIGRLRRLVGARPPAVGGARLEGVLAEVDAMLAPETSLGDLLDGPEDDEDELLETFGAEEITVELYVKTLGLPMSGLARLSPTERRRADAFAARSMSEPAAAVGLRKLLGRAYGKRTIEAAVDAYVARSPF